MLADRGEYIASESTMYRLLREHNMMVHRQASAPVRRHEPTPRVATGPNRVWSWDIVRHEAHDVIETNFRADAPPDPGSHRPVGYFRLS